MKVLNFIKNNLDFVLIFIISLLFFFLVYGYEALDMNNINLCLRPLGNKSYLFDMIGGHEDIMEHYLGSVFYRLDDWHLKIFYNSKIVYPFGTSVLNTDSMPIFALIFKILHKFFNVSPYLQYFGLWILLSTILQGIFSVLVFRKIFNNKVLIILSSIFLLLSPIMISAVFEHSVLTAHWFILASILLYLSEYKFIKTEVYWWILYTLCVLIQPNFLPMIFLFFLSKIIKDIWIDKKATLKNIVIYCLILAIFEYILISQTGLLVGNSYGSYGWQIFTLNLNSLFNSMGFSLFLPALPREIKQFAGFNYFGLGLILLFLYSLINIKLIKKEEIKAHLPLIILSVLTLFYSLSNMIYLNNTLVLYYYLPNKILELCNIFRTAGRFFWPLWYLLVLYIMFVLNRRIQNKKKLIIIVLLALFIQILDLLPLLATKKAYIKYCTNTPYRMVLSDKKWDAWFKKYDGVFFTDDSFNVVTYYGDFWIRAMQNGKGVNNGYLSRFPKESTNLTNEVRENMLKGKILNDKYLYIIDVPFAKILYSEAKKSFETRKTVNKIQNVNGFFVIAP